MRRFTRNAAHPWRGCRGGERVSHRVRARHRNRQHGNGIATHARQRVRDRDEVGPRRVERIQERARLADQRPAISAVEALLAPVGEVRHLQEVLDLIEPAIQ